MTVDFQKKIIEIKEHVRFSIFNYRIFFMKHFFDNSGRSQAAPSYALKTIFGLLKNHVI